MKIVVCVKRVPDTETRIRIDAQGLGIDPAGVKHVVSPYDEFALEAALRLKDETACEVSVMTIGGEECVETLRTCLAMGADRAVLLRGAFGQDGLAIAKALAEALTADSPDLLLFGLKAADDDQQQVGPMVGTLMGHPCATAVASFGVEGERVICEREVEGGVQTVTLPLPSVLTITKGAHQPRYPSLKGIMAAKKKPMEIREALAGPQRISVRKLELPPERDAGRIVGEGVGAVPELVRLLAQEARVL